MARIGDFSSRPQARASRRPDSGHTHPTQKGAQIIVQRIALLIGGLGAAAALTVALAAAGFAPSNQPAGTPATPTAASAPPGLMDAVVDQAAPEPITQVDTVYVKPAPSPQIIRVVKPAPTRPPIIVHKVVPAATSGHEGGDGGAENESESD